MEHFQITALDHDGRVLNTRTAEKPSDLISWMEWFKQECVSLDGPMNPDLPVFFVGAIGRRQGAEAAQHKDDRLGLVIAFLKARSAT